MPKKIPNKKKKNSMSTAAAGGSKGARDGANSWESKYA